MNQLKKYDSIKIKDNIDNPRKLKTGVIIKFNTDEDEVLVSTDDNRSFWISTDDIELNRKE